ncbi:MAG: hypothetical protein AAGA32_01570 [Pseudomonadota bacterium]
MGRLIKYLFYLAVIAALATAVHALFFDLPPPTHEIVIPVSPVTE